MLWMTMQRPAMPPACYCCWRTFSSLSNHPCFQNNHCIDICTCWLVLWLNVWIVLICFLFQNSTAWKSTNFKKKLQTSQKNAFTQVWTETFQNKTKNEFFWIFDYWNINQYRLNQLHFAGTDKTNILFRWFQYETLANYFFYWTFHHDKKWNFVVYWKFAKM